MISLKDSQGNPTTIPLTEPLEKLVQPLFASIPSLEFRIHKTTRDIEGINVHAFKVNVYDGEQHLGRVGYVQKYTRSGYVDVYQIESRRIRKERGDRNSKTTSSLKTALKIAKEVFVKDSMDTQASKIITSMQSQYNGLVWQAGKRYKAKCENLLVPSFEYVLSVIDEAPQPIDPVILQEVKSDSFRQARDNYRIAKSLFYCMNNGQGAVVYTDIHGKLSFIDADSKKFSKIESTYDLPTNYQEKYTILKVMELNQPIEHVGVKIEFQIDELDSVKRAYYYLAPGDTVVTH